MPERLISIREAAHRVGLGKTTVYKRIAAGTFPTPVTNGHKTMFHLRDIIAYMDALPPPAGLERSKQMEAARLGKRGVA